MTDNEIIKVLDCCTDESYENCNECPYSIDTVSCERMKLLEDSLDLINRQQAEYNNLLGQFRILDCECGRLEKAELENLND